MATRPHTDLFLRLRHEALAERRAEEEQGTGDNIALVGSARGTRGEESVAFTRGGIAELPPEWCDGVEEIQFELTKIKQRIHELQAIHDKHMNRPSFDDTMEEEHEIEIMTQEITQMFHRCQKLIQGIGNRGRGGSNQETKVTKNVMSSLASSLQDLSVTFRKAQSSYLKRLKNRDEREKQLFDTPATQVSSFMEEENVTEDELYDRGFTENQLGLVEDNSAMVEEREREIIKIVQSIADLNEIFRDLATMIVEQGTVLDRIDYNIEQAAVKIEEGVVQLQKAEKSHKGTRKMLCIIVLALLVVGGMVVYIALKVK
ncbi:syntaxin-16-like [Sycon ciliatum]|uniref:syntaxin-16-like n=1 Tax=Sycon ciliatum TaxID=27933 RepID=UPI0031F60CE9